MALALAAVFGGRTSSHHSPQTVLPHGPGSTRGFHWAHRRRGGEDHVARSLEVGRRPLLVRVIGDVGGGDLIPVHALVSIGEEGVEEGHVRG